MRLKPEQNMALQGLSLKAKLERLKKWREAGEVTDEQLRYFSNRWFKKEHRRSTEPQGNKCRYKTVLEIRLFKLCQELQHDIKKYVAYRNRNEVMLKDETLKEIRNVLGTYRQFPVLDEFLVIAMRYPDKRLNEMAVEYVKKWRMESLPFWAKLWADENLVPNDAIRVMMPEDGQVTSSLSKEYLRYLLPLIEAQRNKEIQRLEWAEATGFLLTAQRRNKRLEAFNSLIKAIKKL